ncbi:outer membrane beta-barrel protein [Lewinella sp. IMCC34191]|uniref:outer membrane beta-barrel protein n=1 Tax=Lewinella sp. IMCC34191 TaxID=2259172 RepID=UPI000E234EFA|nr:outer membrane beta-barrel protein [Lewinella sp. IMCC34191]
MRNLFLSLLCFGCGLSLTAQMTRGDQLIALTSSFPAAQTVGAWSLPQAAHNFGLQYDGRSESTALYYGGEYSYALLDRLMLGAGVFGIKEFGENGTSSIFFQPRLRYYLVNAPSLQVFGQVSSIVAGADSDRQSGGVQLAAGAHYPLTDVLLLTPQLSYYIDDGKNSLMLELALQLRLSKKQADKISAGIRRGRVMVGAQSARLAFRDGATGAGLEVGGHYFIADRLAIGGQLGYSGDYLKLGTGGGNSATLDYVQWNAAAAVRYYLSTAGRLAWFTEAGTGLSRTSISSDIQIDVDTASREYLFLGGGLQFFTSEQFSLEAAPTVRYSFESEDWRYGLNFGVRYLL